MGQRMCGSGVQRSLAGDRDLGVTSICLIVKKKKKWMGLKLPKEMS